MVPSTWSRLLDLEEQKTSMWNLAKRAWSAASLFFLRCSRTPSETPIAVGMAATVRRGKIISVDVRMCRNCARACGDGKECYYGVLKPAFVIDNARHPVGLLHGLPEVCPRSAQERGNKLSPSLGTFYIGLLFVADFFSLQRRPHQRRVSLLTNRL